MNKEIEKVFDNWLFEHFMGCDNLAILMVKPEQLDELKQKIIEISNDKNEIIRLKNIINDAISELETAL